MILHALEGSNLQRWPHNIKGSQFSSKCAFKATGRKADRRNNKISLAADACTIKQLSLIFFGSFLL